MRCVIVSGSPTLNTDVESYGAFCDDTHVSCTRCHLIDLII